MERSEPRIIARGEWEQNEFGDLSYIPRHKAPPMGDARGNIGPWQEGRDPDDLPVDEYVPGAPTDPAVAAAMAELMAERDAATGRQGRDGAGSGAGSRGGYASVSQEMWKAAGQDYLAGDTAEMVGARYGMGVSTFRARAADEGWRRRDQPDPDPVDGPLDAADLLDEPTDFAVMADQALARLNRAVRSGRAMEAARWMRLHLSLAALARQQDAAPPPPKPEPPDRIDRAAAVAREIGVIAREAAALTRGDIAGRDALMARVDALDDLSPPPISDELHYSDGVFAQGGSETGPPAPQIVIPEPSEAKTPEPRTAPPP
ncbi:MAG: hypothetical protein P0Y50_02245 [Candidatus Brevundimonas colombiensis]|uniref:Uncharacterized protein n=1 Tax=Candidatus Brevundimonas colombiensis TaxID=3121376 RepID=A0AAJ5X1F7_9CAUL|nr:hypothetical protein [Brevundimonas sp.]WEK40448.1 MAG: hypothetical protein P0Y50_02245 [Brevundimonas sp.]